MARPITVTSCSLDTYGTVLKSLTRPGNSISFLQAPFYGAWQQADGKTVHYFTAESDGNVLAAGLGVRYTAPGGLTFLYCPYGPVVTAWTTELLAALQNYFKDIAGKLEVTFVRLDSDGLSELPGVKTVPNALAVTASLQPRAEWLLDLSSPQDDIWMGMHKHARYNVRLNERADARLDLYAPGEAPLETFFGLMQTTAGRDGFSILSREYYQAVLASIPAECGFVAVCSIDGKPAAAALFAAYDGVMHYVFAGSSDEFRKIAPPYFIIWNAILEAKKRGWHTLNFGGVSDTVKGTHLAGVTGFKKRFGGYEVTHQNPVDLVYKPFHYFAFGIYKRIRH